MVNSDKKYPTNIKIDCDLLLNGDSKKNKMINKMNEKIVNWVKMVKGYNFQL